jgi:ribosomal-protein-alanine N-acetyltransferase
VGEWMIKEGSIKDFKELLEIERLCFPREEAYSSSYLKYLLKRSDALVFVALAERRIVGFIITLLHRDTMQAHITTLSIHPSFRRKGYGKLLLQTTEERIKNEGMTSCYLEVRVHNEAAINLYKKLGYRIEEVVKDYYTYPFLESRDAYLMTKIL